MQALWALGLMLAFLIGESRASYRHLHIDSGDMCSERFPNRHKRVSIGTGAIILQLSKPRIAFHSSKESSKLCEIHVEAPEGFGILAYIEDAYLRLNKSDESCKDYIQFGQDDSVPFVTVVKSEPKCGRINGKKDPHLGYFYDDPHGNLLIWVNLFGRKKTQHWPAIYKVNLTLVLTAYQQNCGSQKTSTAILKNVQPPGPGFAWCGLDPGPCISKDYFCDKRFNCQNSAYDEKSCKFENNTQVDHVEVEGSDPDEEFDDEVLVDPSSLNTISWILIGICSFIGVLLIITLAIGCTRNSFCQNSSASNLDCQTNPHELNLAQLSANRLETEPNLYIPLETFRQNNTEEPPPSYDSLFPND